MLEIMTAHRTWVEVDLAAIRHNFRHLQEMTAPARLLPVVKSEAYGHGLLQVARAVVEEGAWGLGVVTVEEGVRLRQAGFSCPVVILGPSFEFEMEEAVQRELSLAVYSVDQAEELSRWAARLGKSARVHVKVDTGLGRLAVPAAQGRAFVRFVYGLPGLTMEGIYSHLADAEGLDQTYTHLQFSRFQNLLQELEQVGIRPAVRHIAGSAAGMLLPEARLDLVRPGISLYGFWPAEETRALMLSKDLGSLLRSSFDQLLRPALAFKTLVAQVKSLPEGTLVGYGCTYQTKRETRAAVLPVGYAEGYDRHLSNQGEVLIRGRRARVMGRVCMNMTTVDVTDIPDVQAGDEAVLIGCQGSQRIRAEELASKIGTINYEVVTRLPVSLPRVYRDA